MKHDNWPYEYGPPPKGLPDGDHGWPGSWLFLGFAIVAPFVYIGPELRMIEAWLVAAYRSVESWLVAFSDRYWI
jgi:hypothetical protein